MATEPKKIPRLAVLYLIALVGGLFIAPLIVLLGRWFTIEPIVYIGIAFYVFWLPLPLKLYFDDRKIGKAPPTNIFIITLVGSSVAIWIMASALGAWALLGLVLWIGSWVYMGIGTETKADSRREKYRRQAIKVFGASFVGLIVTLLVAPDASLRSSFHPIQILMVVLGLIAFYSLIQAINPGESVGTFYLINCPHCGWSNKISRIASRDMSDPLYRCENCGLDFQWLE